MDLIGPISKYIIQQYLDIAMIKNRVNLACMTIIDPATDWFEIIKMSMYDLDDVMGSNYECIYKLSARVSQLFNNTWLSIYPRP